MGRKGTRVLLKRPAGKEVEPTDKFAYNKAFSSDRIKFKINQIQQDLSVSSRRSRCLSVFRGFEFEPY
jgi:cullin-4